MNNLRKPTSDIAYVRNLVEAGWDGVASALRKKNAAAVAPALSGAVWVSTAIGAVLGVWQASRSKSRRSEYDWALGGLVGSALGFGCGAAWESKGLAEAAARSAIHEVITVRDAHWLEKNPVTYA